MEPNTEAIGEFLQHAPQGAEPGDTLVVPGWGQREWSTLLSCAQPVELDTGEVLIQQGEEDCVLYFVTSGRLEVATIDSAGGGIVSLASISAGSVVGELAFFDGAPRSADIVAETDATLRLSHAALRIWSLLSNAPYHLVEKPPQTVTSLDSLNE